MPRASPVSFVGSTRLWFTVVLTVLCFSFLFHSTFCLYRRLAEHVLGVGRYDTALFTDCFARLRGRPSLGRGSGWQAVATEGDERVEMAEQRTRAAR